MFGDLLGGLKSAVDGNEADEKIVVEQGPLDAGSAISAIDERAATGDITYQVSGF